MGKLHAASLFYLPCQPSRPAIDYCGFFKKFKGDSRKPLKTREWIDKYVEYEREPIMSTFIETPVHTSLGPPPARSSTVDEAAVARAIEWWHGVSPAPGQDNYNFFLLGKGLAEAGCDPSRIADILSEGAELANTPEDRKRQILSVLDSLYSYGLLL